ncbi:MAG TPA: 5-formyltetrahydrofolate cyclo-ligase [Candidatus Acidoferrum sp.]|nr:5-formyltetrahydrofolate cyclo-ligase [Candidatus Acidoferrum sp.]
MERPAKATLREQVRLQLFTLAPELRGSLSQMLCDLIRSQPAWRDAASVMLFSPLRDEPEVSALLNDALAERKLVCLPRFDGAQGVYSGAQVSSRADLVAGRFGALEPNADCPVVPLNHLDLVLVPGIAFDLAGRRLGRGKGFYDRLLAEVSGHKCGVVFDVQIVAEIPEEPHDVRVNSIVTPTRWLGCGLQVEG